MSSRSSTRSGSDASVPPIDDNGPSRAYNILRPMLHRHYDIKSADDQPLFYGEVSEFTPSKPDLILYAGANGQAPVVAVSKFQKMSGSCKLGLGDPDDINSVKWEDMTREVIYKSRYRIETTIQHQFARTEGERRSFLWKRTRSVGVDDSAPSKWTTQNYKLVDEQTEQIVAVFTGTKRPGKVGKLQIRAEYGTDFDRMVLISCLSLCEKARRRRHGAGSGGGG
ncbi:uncharacterized protein N7515_006199 [Penicillium bovifimosum]|uniref:Uncharacterized protein n=1 Tax=Penicillium bovifimosum TaxID=126998 RepID=A0A9W9L0V7_9EURO|nr:uncharacterized protein N7515_006199 [Penicillium bovifimosum]KAJ5130160.1 hypothetical protein N7515_006199 [Penicillium bovifimosum]